MKVKVEQCWSGSSGGTWKAYDGMYFRLTLPEGERLCVGGGSWNRQTAKAAKDLIIDDGRVPACDRDKIRFDVH